MVDQITQEDVQKQYETYPDVFEGGIQEKHYMVNRLGPLLYEIKKDSKVLDIGCNTGEFMKIIKEMRGAKVWGIDLSSDCIDKAQKEGLDAIVARAEKLPFHDKSFDYVILAEVLSHVFDSAAVLKEVKRVLKPSGVLLGSTPHLNIETYLYEEKRFHRRYYEEHSLLDELRPYFKKNYTKTLNGAQFALAMGTSLLGNKPAEILFKCGDEAQDFDEALLDKSVLRVWMGFTQAPGTVYYRMSGYAEKMRDLGAEIAFNPYNHDNPESTSDWQGRIRGKILLNQLETLLKAADLSVWQVTSSQDVLAFLMCAKDILKKPIVLEMDDWIFDLPAYNIASHPYQPANDLERYAFKQIEISDAAIVSTNFIKEQLQPLFKGKAIHVVKNTIDFDIWDNIKSYPTIAPKKEGVIRMIYTGCGNHSGDVSLLKKPVLALLEEFPNLEMVFPIQFESWSSINHPRVINANKWVSLPEFPGMIKGWEGDIGVAPLRDNTFNCAKSNLRWLEYSALKLPSVVSNVQPFFESVNPGKTGFLASNQNEWYAYLKALIKDEQLRREIGENAYQEVKANFNMDQEAKHYIEVLEDIKRRA